MLLDVGSLSLLLWKLGAAWYAAIALGGGVGGLTTYQAQWRWLLSRRAYRRSARAGRYVAVALFVLVTNLGGAGLVARGHFTGYLFLRVATAVLVLVAWWRDRAGSGDGFKTFKTSAARFFTKAPRLLRARARITRTNFGSSE